MCHHPWKFDMIFGYFLDWKKEIKSPWTQKYKVSYSSSHVIERFHDNNHIPGIEFRIVAESSSWNPAAPTLCYGHAPPLCSAPGRRRRLGNPGPNQRRFNKRLRDLVFCQSWVERRGVDTSPPRPKPTRVLSCIPWRMATFLSPSFT